MTLKIFTSNSEIPKKIEALLNFCYANKTEQKKQEQQTQTKETPLFTPQMTQYFQLLTQDPQFRIRNTTKYSRLAYTTLN